MDENYLDTLLGEVSEKDKFNNDFDMSVDKDAGIDVDLEDFGSITLSDMDGFDELGDLDLDSLDLDDIDFDDLDMTKLEEYPKWLAYYQDEFYFPYDFQIWQYSEKGRVDGIKGDVDMNLLLKELY